jgi:hypothetical protein
MVTVCCQTLLAPWRWSSWKSHWNSQGQHLTLLPVQVLSAIEEQGPENTLARISQQKDSLVLNYESPGKKFMTNLHHPFRNRRNTFITSF